MVRSLNQFSPLEIMQNELIPSEAKSNTHIDKVLQEIHILRPLYSSQALTNNSLADITYHLPTLFFRSPQANVITPLAEFAASIPCFKEWYTPSALAS